MVLRTETILENCIEELKDAMEKTREIRKKEKHKELWWKVKLGKHEINCISLKN